MLNFKVEDFQDFVIISVNSDGPITPEILKTLEPPDPIKGNFAHKGVILAGREPIWLYGFLIHFYHPTKYIATYDPRLKGAVVVESHCQEHLIGDIILIDQEIV